MASASGKTADAVRATPAILQLRLLGRLAVLRDGDEVALPASRKVRALLAHLVCAPAEISRIRLCELLWDGPDDPRGELRWCLSKLRSVLDDPGRSRVVTKGDTVGLDLTDCLVDVADLTRTMQAGVEKIATDSLREIVASFTGEFADGLETDRNPQFASWLGAQRRLFRTWHAAALEQLAARLGDECPSESLEYLERWLQIMPFEERGHRLLLGTLVRCGRIQEGEEHLAATIRLFESEGLDWLAIREAWRGARSQAQQAQQDARPTIQMREAAAVERVDSRVEPAPLLAIPDSAATRRASICVMPFIERTPEGLTRGGLADGLTEDIITRLAKLRVLFVIARGSVYALGERNIPPEEAGRLLNVDYVVSGSVRRYADRVIVTAELSEARVARIVWVEEFPCKVDDALAIFDEVGNRIVASIAEEIEATERNRAILKSPGSLNAWEAYHRGLWHMYRFNGDDNTRAAHFFQMALKRDRTFARAHACLSFTHFQNAFLHRTAARDSEIARACEAAGESLVADDRDPAAHWAMGRALWLRGALDESLVEIEKSLTLSPNFALGHYTRGFIQCQAGDPRAAIESTDYSRHLSPFDPLQFAMLATRAIALLRLGQYDDAADWAIKAAARPNAHIHILGIAVNCLAAAGRFEEASQFVARARRATPGYGLQDFLASFRLEPGTEKLLRLNAGRAGFG
ncbi:MAG: BTAD domain-containing putative transcriptional regulator [Gammaproteobacteria bacterium]